MEAKLREYRARKRQEAMMSAAKDLLFNTLSTKKYEKELAPPGSLPREEDSRSEIASSEVSESESFLSDSTTEVIGKSVTWFTVVTYCLYLTLWGTLYCIAIHYEFGTVYLIVSALYGIWINTRTGPKRKGEVSAYSVFNPNCEAIDGTLNAEQFDREIRYGPSSVR